MKFKLGPPTPTARPGSEAPKRGRTKATPTTTSRAKNSTLLPQPDRARSDGHAKVKTTPAASTPAVSHSKAPKSPSSAKPSETVNLNAPGATEHRLAEYQASAASDAAGQSPVDGADRAMPVKRSASRETTNSGRGLHLVTDPHEGDDVDEPDEVDNVWRLDPDEPEPSPRDPDWAYWMDQLDRWMQENPDWDQTETCHLKDCKRSATTVHVDRATASVTFRCDVHTWPETYDELLFVQVPLCLLTRGSASVFQVYGGLVSYANKNNDDEHRTPDGHYIVWPSYPELASRLGISESTVKRCVKALIDVGIVEIVGKKRRANVYALKVTLRGQRRRAKEALQRLIDENK
jgi:Replication protein C N-terminal domain